MNLRQKWRDMCRRCRDKNNHLYGGRGISVCGEWNDFKEFEKWSYLNGYRDDLSIERIDVNGNYEPSNCCWIPREEQHYNKQNTKYLTAFGERKSIHLWLSDPRCVVERKVLETRINKYGWDHERALSTPNRTNIVEYKGEKRSCPNGVGN